jgi:HAD superfamily hydrolase (TIGR01509 family)
VISLWDLGNVMVRWDPQGILASLDCPAHEVALLRDELLMHDDWQRLDQGTVDESSVALRLVDQVGIAPDSVAQCFRLSRESLVNIEPSIELLQKVKAAGQRAYCLSNMSHSTYEHLRDRYFFEYFDGIVISAQERMIKPDAGIFNLVLDRFDLQAPEVLFIDDSAANVQSATALGIDCVHFKGSSQCYASICSKLGLD